MVKDEPESDDAIALTVALNLEAPDGLRRFAEQYWDLLGVNRDSGDPEWRYKTTELDFKLWAGTASYAAAAGAVATAEDFRCSTCGGPLSLTSRTALLEVRRDRNVDCRDCNGVVDGQAVEILSGRGQGRRAARLAQKEKEQAARLSISQLETDRRAVITSTYLVESDSEEYLLDQASLFARIGVLSVINGIGEQDGIVAGIQFDDQLIGPSNVLGRELFVEAWSAGLLAIHPSTATNSLEWQEGTATATGAIYTPQVRFFAPGAGSLPQRMSDLVDAAHIRVQVAGMWSTQRAQLRAFAERLVAEEATRYLTFQVAAHQLPYLTDKNNEALKLVTERGASLFSLGHLYGFAWRAARDASSAYQTNKGMPGEKAITHGLRKFETYIQAAVDNPASLKDPYDEYNKVPLSAVTRLVFNDILGINPMRAAPEDIANALSSPPDDELREQCDLAIPSRSELMEWIRTSTESWTPSQFCVSLARLEDWHPDLCAPHCAHERVAEVAREAGRVYDRIVSRVDGEAAAILTAEATGVANALQDDVRTGDAVLAELVRMLRSGPLPDDRTF